MERIMTAINTTPASADELGTLLAQIATLTKQADALKDAMKDLASNGGPTVFEGALFKASYVESNRAVTDWKKWPLTWASAPTRSPNTPALPLCSASRPQHDDSVRHP